MKKILICGATGFIGRNIAEFFAQRKDFKVYGTYHHSKPWLDPRVKLLQTDLLSKAAVSQVIKGMDIIIQAAATTSGVKDTIYQPYYHVTDNVVMNSLIYRAAFERKISHVIFFSCTTMYPSSEVPVKETDFDANCDILPSYFGIAWTKVYLEKMCAFYAKLGNTKFTAIRHSNIYGPYDKFDLQRSHVFAATMTKVMRAKDGGKITVWGTGEEKRDLLYISDLVHFVELALKRQKTKFELMNVGSGQAVSINDLVKKIIKHSGKKISVDHDARKPTISTKLCVDSTKAKTQFGWLPAVSLDKGIQKTFAWYAKNIKGILSSKKFSKKT